MRNSEKNLVFNLIIVNSDGNSMSPFKDKNINLGDLVSSIEYFRKKEQYSNLEVGIVINIERETWMEPAVLVLWGDGHESRWSFSTV